MSYKIDKHARYAVIGYGSWATALVKIILENNHNVGWYIRNPEVLNHIRQQGSNPRYLRDVHFQTSHLKLSDNINTTVEEADVLILAVPSVYLQATLEPLTHSLHDKFVISAIKGIIPNDLLTITEYINRRYEIPFSQLGVISGPCHAEEVALERLSYLTVVCKEIDNACTIGETIHTPYINVSHSTDIYGTEYASVLKNIYAIAVGICIGLGYGDNFLAVLIANCDGDVTIYRTDLSGPTQHICIGLFRRFIGYLILSIQPQSSIWADGRQRLPHRCDKNGDAHGGRGILSKRMYRSTKQEIQRQNTDRRNGTSYFVQQ